MNNTLLKPCGPPFGIFAEGCFAWNNTHQCAEVLDADAFVHFEVPGALRKKPD